MITNPSTSQICNEKNFNFKKIKIKHWQGHERQAPYQIDLKQQKSNIVTTAKQINASIVKPNWVPVSRPTPNGHFFPHCLPGASLEAAYKPIHFYVSTCLKPNPSLCKSPLVQGPECSQTSSLATSNSFIPTLVFSLCIILFSVCGRRILRGFFFFVCNLSSVSGRIFWFFLCV